jgi:hypothetical protein
MNVPVATSILDDLIAVGSVGHGGDIVTVDTEIAVVLVHPLQGGQVGGVGDNLVDPLAGSNSGVSKRAFSSPESCIVHS